MLLWSVGVTYFPGLGVGSSVLLISYMQHFTLILRLQVCIVSDVDCNCPLLADSYTYLFLSGTSTTPCNQVCKLRGRIGTIMNEYITYNHNGLIICTIVRCSPPMSDYLYDSGKNANSQHSTGKDLSMILLRVWPYL